MGRISQRSRKRAEKEFNIYFKSMEKENKQTAVEWLAWKFATTDTEDFKDNFNSFLSEAKAMEKDQIIQANLEGQFHADGIKANTVAEQYYNETFNK